MTDLLTPEEREAMVELSDFIPTDNPFNRIPDVSVAAKVAHVLNCDPLPRDIVLARAVRRLVEMIEKAEKAKEGCK